MYRRKRERKTNYAKRLKLLMSRKKRLVVRFSNKKILAQVVEFTPNGDKVLTAVDSSALKKLGWTYSGKNIPAAYLTGLLLGKKALAEGHKEAILDIGDRLSLHKGKVFAFLKGVLDSEMEVSHGSDDIFPDEERLTGKHIKDHAEKMTETFEQVKLKIKG